MYDPILRPCPVCLHERDLDELEQYEGVCEDCYLHSCVDCGREQGTHQPDNEHEGWLVCDQCFRVRRGRAA